MENLIGNKLELFKFQEKIINKIHNKNALITMPTNSGKTLVAYHWLDIFTDYTPSYMNIIFTSPIKALSNERYKELKKAGKDVGLITGDVKYNINAQILCMTQEIYAQGHYKTPSKIVIDEFHYIFNNHDRARCYIESIYNTNPKSQLLLMSATISEPERIAKYLRSLNNIKYNVATSEERLVPLKIDKKGITLSKVRDAIIFCFSRRNISKIIDLLCKERSKISKYKEKEILELSIKNKIDFMDEWCYGISKYHGKLLPKEKLFIEFLYRNDYIDTVVGTDSLALGVNLPAKYSIIAQITKPTGEKLKTSEFLQLIGRAGRYGQHDIGIATFLKDSPVENKEVNLEKMFAYLVDSKLEEVKIETEIDIQSLFNGRHNEEEAEYLYLYRYPKSDDEKKIKNKYLKEVIQVNDLINKIKDQHKSNLDISCYNIWNNLLKTYYLPEWNLIDNCYIALKSTNSIYNNSYIDIKTIIEDYIDTKDLCSGEYLQELLLLNKWKNKIKKSEFFIKNDGYLTETINNMDHTIFNPEIEIA